AAPHGPAARAAGRARRLVPRRRPRGRAVAQRVVRAGGGRGAGDGHAGRGRRRRRAAHRGAGRRHGRPGARPRPGALGARAEDPARRRRRARADGSGRPRVRGPVRLGPDGRGDAPRLRAGPEAAHGRVTVPSGGPPSGRAGKLGQDGGMTYTLVLLRHGESEWNAKNLFTGWVDVALSEKGVEEAKRGGALLKEAGVNPDVLHTSLLRRAIMT